MTGYLMLETGDVFKGDWIGADLQAYGELVFNTGMTGYQEMMTDPSYKGQILTFSYPLIGNYGLNQVDAESKKVAVSAVLLNDVCDNPSHYLSNWTFDDYLKEQGIPGLKNMDTRKLVSIIRKQHTVKAVISKELLSTFPSFESGELVKEVSVGKTEVHGEGEKHVALYDFGYKKSILDALVAEGCKVTIVPYNYSFEKLVALKPDGVLFSNGPGDPMTLAPYFELYKKITASYPTLGICLGHQLVALSYGAKTEKMLFGHRGGNHPVKHLPTGKVSITSQNHGYVVTDSTIDTAVFDITFKNVNDGSLEGIKHKELPVQSVQFHPEAHPGPSDTAFIFEEFLQQVQAGGKKACLITQ
ncbi:carbamoyl phosphate synthase small subunit [Paenalkalicoccus suaedae]|uniref:Carbamoyl phosphate synthase small chain n=1 Tax=Paenalkalicoccus suaedae TaxID=2592382 RepID=A0A859FG73_9BACI|nr:carbamoyl phosphate synthase small subunit [Paenalkalicoccus suaedae]QKS71226.1 carbamoyl phosphate synthase small subunit [Paenalkalicoccus suaedae]